MSTYCSVKKQEASRIEVKINVCCARNLTMYQFIHQLSTFSGECPCLKMKKAWQENEMSKIGKHSISLI
jgi:hypothetical protein